MDRPSGILLAGGRSRRFGRDKVLASFRGAPLFHSPLLALRSVCSEVVVVVPPDAPELPLPARIAEVRFVHDGIAFAGPLSGCRTGLAAVRGRVALVAGADMPGLSAPVLELLAERASIGGRAAVVLRDEEGYRPLPAAVRVDAALDAANDLLDKRGERRLRALIDALGPEVVPPDAWERADPRGAWREDVDEPGDLERAART